MNNITQYSDSELSLIVFNDEGLYNMRHDPVLFDLINDAIIYTPEQLEELKTDLADDLGEQND